MEQAQALMRQADELLRRAGELGEARDRVLASVREMQRQARALGRPHVDSRGLAWGLARKRLHQQAVSRLLEQARQLGESRDRLLASAESLKAQAMRLMRKHGR